MNNKLYLLQYLFILSLTQNAAEAIQCVYYSSSNKTMYYVNCLTKCCDSYSQPSTTTACCDYVTQTMSNSGESRPWWIVFIVITIIAIGISVCSRFFCMHKRNRRTLRPFPLRSIIHNPYNFAITRSSGTPYPSNLQQQQQQQRIQPPQRQLPPPPFSMVTNSPGAPAYPSANAPTNTLVLDEPPKYETVVSANNRLQEQFTKY